jgi:hypothetical protein
LNQRKRNLAMPMNPLHLLFPLSDKKMMEKILHYPLLLRFPPLPLQRLLNPLKKMRKTLRRSHPLQRKTQ